MFLIQKYTQYKAAQAEQQKRKVTEKELSQLNHKIVRFFITFVLLLPGLSGWANIWLAYTDWDKKNEFIHALCTNR